MHLRGAGYAKRRRRRPPGAGGGGRLRCCTASGLLVGDLDVGCPCVDVEQVAGLGRRGCRSDWNLIARPSALFDAGMLVLRTAASTFERLGVLPDLQTDAIASMTTVVASQRRHAERAVRAVLLDALDERLRERRSCSTRCPGRSSTRRCPGSRTDPGSRCRRCRTASRSCPAAAASGRTAAALPALCHGTITRCVFEFTCEVASEERSLWSVAPVSVPL